MSNTPTSQIHSVSLLDLKPYHRRARKHAHGKLKGLIKSIQASGLIDPVVIDEANVILSGHLRVEAFRSLECGDIPAIRVSHLTKEQKAAYVIAANRFPERGGWDNEVLRLEFAELVDINCDLEIETTGFEIGEVDLILGSDPGENEESPIPEPPKVPIARTGDLWRLGDHLLLCGDSLVADNWTRLMGEEKAVMCFTDPPYNVPIAGHVSSKGHAEFAMASGEMSPEEFITFLQKALSCAADVSVDGALHYIAMDHRHLRELYAACDAIFSEQLNLIVWAKTNAGMGSMYRSGHELIGLFKVGQGPHANNVQLGRFGRNRTNVWRYPGANTFRKGRDKDLADHPTVKPTALVADAILDASRPGDIVIDGFGGSGTLILAAEQSGRFARMIEYGPRYVDVAIRRWQEATGRQAVLEGTKESFDTISKERLASASDTGDLS
ncbi:MAG: DNA methylase N-4 [Hirschia sp.]|nr:DNA methylase N-4 [Hirschia sp.]MBB36294.1 DNA methylase N-4 [Hirschia sp.]MBF17908.1 DNA methylase N-4 [Hirschia sp.]